MSTWSLTGGGLDRWLSRTSRSIYEYVCKQVRVDVMSSPAAAPKSVPFDALAMYEGVRQRGFKL